MKVAGILAKSWSHTAEIGSACKGRGTKGSNPLPSSKQSVSAVKPEALREKLRTVAAFCGWLGPEKGRAGCEPGLLRLFSLTALMQSHVRKILTVYE